MEASLKSCDYHDVIVRQIMSYVGKELVCKNEGCGAKKKFPDNVKSWDIRFEATKIYKNAPFELL